MREIDDAGFGIDGEDHPLHTRHERVPIAEIGQQRDEPRGCGTLQLLEANLHHFVFDHLDRRLDLDKIADSLSDQRFADRRLNRDAVHFHVGFILSHQRILPLRLRLLFNHEHRGAEHDGVGDSSGRFDDTGVGQLRLQFHDARLDESLAFLGGIVLRILAQIAMGARFSNGFDIFGTLDFAQTIKLCFEAPRAPSS